MNKTGISIANHDGIHVLAKNDGGSNVVFSLTRLAEINQATKYAWVQAFHILQALVELDLSGAFGFVSLRMLMLTLAKFAINTLASRRRISVSRSLPSNSMVRVLACSTAVFKSSYSFLVYNMMIEDQPW